MRSSVLENFGATYLCNHRAMKRKILIAHLHSSKLVQPEQCCKAADSQCTSEEVLGGECRVSAWCLCSSFSW